VTNITGRKTKINFVSKRDMAGRPAFLPTRSEIIAWLPVGEEKFNPGHQAGNATKEMLLKAGFMPGVKSVEP